MRICLMMAAAFALASATSAAEPDRTTAILVSPIHEAQIVRADDGMDHVEYELLVVSVFSEPVTLSSVAVLDPAGKELMRIQGDALAAATQTLFEKTATPVIPASPAVSVDVDLVLPPGIAPERVNHRIAYTLAVDSKLALMIRSLQVDGPEVTINHQPAIVIKSPLRGNGWLAAVGCCKPNIHRDLRVAIDDRRIETGETFAIDWNRVKNDRIYDGDGKKLEQHYAFGQDVLAVADGTIVSIHDGMPDQTPFQVMLPKSEEDYGGNHVMLKIAPNVFAIYMHLQPGSLTVKVGDARQSRGASRQDRQHRPFRRASPAFRPLEQAGHFSRTKPAFRLRQLHLGRRRRLRRLEGRSTGDPTGFAAGSVRLSTRRRHPKLPVA